MSAPTARTAGHETCNHGSAGMSCAEFDLLLDRAADHCELCGVHRGDTSRGLLCIDHDHRYDRGGTGQRGTVVAVRGLVCDRCNSLLRFVDSGQIPAPPHVVAYFARAWFVDSRAYVAGTSPLTRASADWWGWRRFARAARQAGMEPLGVLRAFIAWYSGKPGASLPRRAPASVARQKAS